MSDSKPGNKLHSNNSAGGGGAVSKNSAPHPDLPVAKSSSSNTKFNVSNSVAQTPQNVIVPKSPAPPPRNTATNVVNESRQNIKLPPPNIRSSPPPQEPNQIADLPVAKSSGSNTKFNVSNNVVQTPQNINYPKSPPQPFVPKSTATNTPTNNLTNTPDSLVNNGVITNNLTYEQYTAITSNNIMPTAVDVTQTAAGTVVQTTDNTFIIETDKEVFVNTYENIVDQKYINNIEMSGFSGQSGFSFSGYSGISGQSGDSGPSGYSGFSGYSGASGVGISGYSGVSGRGLSGYSGFSSFSGYSGFSGFSSYSGYSGQQGASNLLLAVEDNSSFALYPVMVAAAGTNQIPKVSPSKIYFNAFTGTIYATSKSFQIPHPTKPGKKLVYGSLEGPENGVYYRGRLQNTTIVLPEYWSELVDVSTTTVSLTAIGHHQKLYVKNILDNEIIIGIEDGLNIDCYFTVFAERKDITRLLVETENLDN